MVRLVGGESRWWVTLGNGGSNTSFLSNVA